MRKATKGNDLVSLRNKATKKASTKIKKSGFFKTKK